MKLKHLGPELRTVLDGLMIDLSINKRNEIIFTQSYKRAHGRFASHSDYLY